MGSAEEITALPNKFYSKGKFTTKTGKTASAYYIKNKIAADKLVILLGTQSNGKVHAVVCYGYNIDGDTYTFNIFDPNNGNGTITCGSKDDTSYSMNVEGNNSETFSTIAFVASTS